MTLKKRLWSSRAGGAPALPLLSCLQPPCSLRLCLWTRLCVPDGAAVCGGDGGSVWLTSRWSCGSSRASESETACEH